jgi:hypothetical protein
MKAPQRKRPCRSQASSVDPVSVPAHHQGAKMVINIDLDSW